VFSISLVAVVLSSDFSHSVPREVAITYDTQTIEAFVMQDVGSMYSLMMDARSAGTVFLTILSERDAPMGQVLSQGFSSDYDGNIGSVTSYASIVWGE
jgi:AmmeMemoRadiSam system protein B